MKKPRLKPRTAWTAVREDGECDWMLSRTRQGALWYCYGADTVPVRVRVVDASDDHGAKLRAENRALRDALKFIENVLGPEPICGVAGCELEVWAALTRVREVLTVASENDPAAEVRRLRRALSRARGLMIGGKYGDACSVIATAVERKRKGGAK